MIDEKKAGQTHRPLHDPVATKDKPLPAVDRAAIGGLAAPTEGASSGAGDETVLTVGGNSDAAKREAEQTLGLPATTSEKMERRMSPAAADGGTGQEELPVEPEDDRDRKARIGRDEPGETLEKLVQQAGLGEGPRRGS
jgi:hypothetical protein